MDRYQLAKLVQWAEGTSRGQLDSRKRMQKVVFLLECAGCPFEADYSLHYYGPYSADLAQLADELVQVGLLDEFSSANRVGKQFTYRLSEEAKASLSGFEATPAGIEACERIRLFESLGKDLLGRDLGELEYAATIAYFQQKGSSWESAFQKTCEFKKLSAESPVAISALQLANHVAK